jgi:hypothetical protein
VAFWASTDRYRLATPMKREVRVIEARGNGAAASAAYQIEL